MALLVVFAALLVSTNNVYAQEQPLHHASLSEEPHGRAGDPAPAGSLLAETLAATGTALGVGALSIGWALHGNNEETSQQAALLYLVAGPLLTSLVTVAVGDATGGDGRGFNTFAASAGGTVGAGYFSLLLVSVVVLGTLDFDDEGDDARDDRIRTMALLGAGALIVTATSVGAVIGYRSSSRSRARHALVPAPTADLRGFSLSVVGTL